MIAHIILAAGAGTRVGMPKGLLPIGGMSLIQRTLRESSAAGDFAVIVVVGANAQEVESSARNACVGSLTIRENKYWESGQTSSIRTGLLALPTDVEAFFIHPVDHALVRADHLRILVDAWRSQRDSMCIVRPVFQNKWGHPVLFGAKYGAEFLNLRDDEPGHTIYRRHREHVIGVPMADDDCSFDLDTRDDLNFASRRLCT